MASITLDKMQELGVDKFCSQICSIQNRTHSDGKELKYLLPIKYIINEYSLRDSISWKSPIDELLITIPYTNEESRIEAIKTINEYIDKYNAEVKKRDDSYNDSIERINKQKFIAQSHYPLYPLTLWCHSPVHQKRNEVFPFKHNQLFDARHFDNEAIYKAIHQCKDEDEAVGRLNQMILEYLEALTDGAELIKTSTFYFPVMEFKDYMMRTGNKGKYKNLLEGEDYKRRIKDEPSPFADLLKDKQHTLNDLILTINLAKKTLSVKHIQKNKSITSSFQDCGLATIGKKAKPNRFVNMLNTYAYYKEQVYKNPAISQVTSACDELLIGNNDERTIKRYLSDLGKILKDLLFLSDSNVFETKRVNIKDTGSAFPNKTIPKSFIDSDLKIVRKDISEHFDGTTKDGFIEDMRQQTYHSDSNN